MRKSGHGMWKVRPWLKQLIYKQHEEQKTFQDFIQIGLQSLMAKQILPHPDLNHF